MKEMINFLFYGNYKWMPKAMIYFLIGWIIAALIEYFTTPQTEVAFLAFGIGMAGTILGAFSFFYTLYF